MQNKDKEIPLSNISPEYLRKLKDVYDAWDNGCYKNPNEKNDAAYRLCDLHKVLFSDLISYSEKYETSKH